MTLLKMPTLRNILHMGEQPPEEHIAELTRQTIGFNILVMCLMLAYAQPVVLQYYAYGVALCFFHLASFGLVPRKPGWMLMMSMLRFVVILIATVWLANGHFQYAVLVLSGCFSYKGIIFTHIALHLMVKMSSKVGKRLGVSFNPKSEETSGNQKRFGRKKPQRLDS